MKHDVFISYSSKDKSVATALCHALEQAGIRCWIAPRDVTPGQPYAAEIVNAIREARLVVLIFSIHSNNSPHVGNEIDKAFNQGKIIIPFRIDKSELNDSLDYYLARKHWIDAYPNPNKSFGSLIQTLTTFLKSQNRVVVPLDTPRKKEGQPHRIKMGIIIACCAIVGLLIVGGLWWGIKNQDLIPDEISEVLQTDSFKKDSVVVPVHTENGKEVPVTSKPTTTLNVGTVPVAPVESGIPEWIFSNQRMVHIGISDPGLEETEAREQAIVRAIYLWAISQGKEINSIIDSSISDKEETFDIVQKMVLSSLNYDIMREYKYKTGEMFVAIQMKSGTKGKLNLTISRHLKSVITGSAEDFTSSTTIEATGFSKLKSTSISKNIIKGKETFSSLYNGMETSLSRYSYPDCGAEQGKGFVADSKKYHSLGRAWAECLNTSIPFTELGVNAQISSLTENSKERETGKEVLSTTSRSVAKGEPVEPYIIQFLGINDGKLSVSIQLDELLRKKLLDEYLKKVANKAK